MSNQIIYLNLAIVVVTIGAFLFFTGRAKAQASNDYMIKQKRKMHNHFTFYYNNVLLRKSFRRIVEMYSSLSAYDYDTVKMKAVQLFERNAIIVVLLPIVTMIIMKDVTVTVLIAFIGMVYYETTVNKEMDAIYITLMEECSLTISSIREKFLETDNIPLAVLYSDKSKYLEIPMNNIYRILTDVDGEEKLLGFQKSYPVRVIKTLANVCHIINENGAVKKENGFDSFSDAMTVLRQECDSEIRRLIKQRIVFKSLQSLSLVGIVLMPILEWYLLTQIPGISVLIKGFYGVAIHAAVIGTSIYSYWYISTANRPSVVNQVDKIGFIDVLSKKKRVSDFVKTYTPKKYKTTRKLNLLIQDSLSSKDLRYIYTAKGVFALFAFVLSFIVLIFGTITVRSNFYNNYNSLSFVPQSVTESQYNQIKKMDDEFMLLTWEEYNEFDEASLTKYCKNHISGISDSEASNQYKRLSTKYETYKNAVYHWWFVLISFGASVLAWYFPELSLKTRKRLVAYEATDDVMQLQTIMIVLSETKMDVYKAICWLEKQSTVHKAILRHAHYSYTADPEKCLEELENKAPSNDFKRLVRKLRASIYTLSLHDAFSDMALDKAQSLTTREMLRNEELEERKNSAKLIAIAPAALALVGDFIGPVLILGIQEITSTLSNLNGFI